MASSVVLSNEEYKVVGKRPIRHDGYDKVTGKGPLWGRHSASGDAGRQGAQEPSPARKDRIDRHQQGRGPPRRTGRRQLQRHGCSRERRSQDVLGPRPRPQPSERQHIGQGQGPVQGTRGRRGCGRQLSCRRSCPRPNRSGVRGASSCQQRGGGHRARLRHACTKSSKTTSPATHSWPSVASSRGSRRQTW